MVMAIGILVVLGMLAVVITTYTTSGQRSASRSSAGVSAYSLAEAGVNNAVSMIARANSTGVWRDHVAYATLLATPTVRSYDAGTARWWGTFDSSDPSGWQWIVTSVGTMPNPTGAATPVTRKLSVKVPVRPSEYQHDANPAWNYIMAARTGTPGGCDEALNNSANIQSPMYVFGNLCLNTPSQITGGDLQVLGYTKLDVNTNIGTAVLPVRNGGVHIGGGCGYKGAALGACGPDKMVFGDPFGADPRTDIVAPAADFPLWYTHAVPGPMHKCAEQSGAVPVFDTNAPTMNDDGVGSVPTVFNLTPPSSDYSCIVRASNNAVVGQLSWNHTTGKLTVAGTIFIDGSITVNYGKTVPVDYDGRATIYATGSIFLSNTNLCAIVANGDCGFDQWVSSEDFLELVADGAGGGQVPVGDSIEVKSSHFEGGLWAKNAVDCLTATRTEGPMFGGHVILDNTVYAHTWPLSVIPAGMPGSTWDDMITDPPIDYS